MQWTTLLASNLALAFALALPSSNHVLHEKRDRPLLHRRERVDPSAIVPLRLGLKQSNLHTGHDRLMEVSDPSSSQYGQYLSADEVHSIFAPADDTVQAVKDWLVSSGISEKDVLSYTNKGWLAVDIPVKDAERLLRTTYYEHDTSDGLRIGCDEYYLPAHVSRHVDFVKPGVKLSAPLKKKVVKRNWPPGGHRRPGYPGPPSIPSNPFPEW